MKGSINRGAVKDGSESLLRALSGPPKCALIGEKDITYIVDLVYNEQGTGQLSFNQNTISPAGITLVDPPKPYPYGQWVCDITYTGLLSLPGVSFKIGMAQIINYAGRAGLPFGFDTTRFLIKGGYDKVFLEEYDGGIPTRKLLTDFTSFWLLQLDSQGPVSSEVIGPDLQSLLSIDLSSATVQSSRTVLPEQSEFCDSYFIPYLFSASRRAGVSPGGVSNAWSSMANGFGQIAINGPIFASVGGGLLPHNSKVGSLKFRFRRLLTMPLFSASSLPPLSLRFNNLTFFNPALAPTWDWDFGDGSAHSTDFSPTHTYPSTGTFKATLRATDETGNKTFDQIVVLPLKADFTFIGINVIRAPGPVFEVNFTSHSIGAVTYDWDFGDGSPHSTSQFPVHDYPRGQTFHATLTINDGTGKTNSITKTINT